MNHNSVFGALMFAAWFNSALLMLESIEVYKCLRRPNRSLSIKCLVIWCYALDIVCSAADCACVYLYTITHWGDETYGMRQHWPMPVEHIATGVVGFTVQLFLLMRYYSLSRNRWISVLIGLVALVSAAAAIMGSALQMKFSSYAERNHLTAPTLIWLVAGTVADWAIAGGLVWELGKRKSQNALRSTDSMICKLISNAIRTGAVTSLLATIDIVNWVAERESNAAVAIGFCLGRVYSLTMLYNINSRGGLSKFRLDSEPAPPQNRETPREDKSEVADTPAAGVFTTTGAYSDSFMEHVDYTGPSASFVDTDRCLSNDGIAQSSRIRSNDRISI